MLTLNGDNVFTGEIQRPLRGRWRAELEPDSADPPSGRVTLTLGDHALDMLGTASVAGEFVERVSVRIVGGAGGLDKSLPAKPYQGVTIRTVVADALAAAGEQLAGLSDPAVLSTSLARWTRREGALSALLDELVARVPGAVWRVLADGTVWIGVPSWPVRVLDGDIVDEDVLERRIDVATDDVTIDAGVTIFGRKITRVRYRFDGGGMSVSLWYAPTAAAHLAAFVDHRVDRRLEAGVAYRAKVFAQHSDGTLDVTPENKRIAPMTNVPVVYGDPGTRAKVRPGAFCYVEFIEGDRSRPIVRGWEAGAIDEITLDASRVRLADGDRAIARKGDLVSFNLTSAHVGIAFGGGVAPIAGIIVSGSDEGKTK